MGATPQVRLPLHRQQGRAFKTAANEILFGGAAGGGKSHLMRSAAIAWCSAVAGLQVYLFRRLYTDLIKNHVEGPHGFRMLMAPLVNAGLASVTLHEIAFWNGSKIYLCHLQNAKALAKYQGNEIHVLLIDELTHFTDEMYRYLRGRCRVAGLKIPPEFAGMFPRIICGSNPGSIGHHWVKAAFVDHGPMIPHRAPKEEGGMLRVFIPALYTDNPSLLADDPGYVDRLEGLGDPLLVRMLKEGDWDVVAGSMFGDVWRKPRHVVAPFALPWHWELWRGADDGYSAPAACYWLTQDPNTRTIYVVRELYRTKMLADDYARRVMSGDREIEMVTQDSERVFNAETLTGLLDSAAFADPGQGDISRGRQMNNLGARWKPVEKWPGSRVARVQNLHRALGPNAKDPAGMPGLRIFDTCRHLIRTLPTLPRDPNDIEDIDTEAEDHAFDGLTYGLQYKVQRVTRMKVGGV